MTAVLLKLRKPWPPHEIIGSSALPDSVRYGFGIMEEQTTEFSLSRASVLTDDPDVLRGGIMVTFERSDQFLPWVGWLVDKRRTSLRDPEASFTVQDHMAALIAEARTQKLSNELTGSGGAILRTVFQEANQRAEPPLMLDNIKELELGPSVSITPKAESLLSFLNKVSLACDWEWELVHKVIPANVSTTLRWRERLGHDRSQEVVFQEKHDFEDAVVSTNAKGFAGAALIVAGSGVFKDRKAIQATATGRSDPGITGEKVKLVSPSSPSPVHLGTRVVTMPTVTNEPAIRAAARRTIRSPRFIRERWTLRLVESKIDVGRIELGSLYGIRFNSIDLGRGVSRVVRCLGIGLDQSGIIEMVAEVEQ